ncbi:MAG TPA: hypothetical protein VG603_11820 [Chitinophagales bacterium]|nr:hypothetical protein [Chitinophagales bacterium]
MLYLLLSVICSAILILHFKFFERNNIPVFQAIVINYLTAAMCGFLFLPQKNEIINGAFLSWSWLPVSMMLGFMFINVFNLTSLTTITFGVSTASVASKLGLVFPLLFAFIAYHEGFNYIKLAGIGTAVVAVVLSSIKNETTAGNHIAHKTGILPFLVFVGNGACDSLTQFANKHYLAHQGNEQFAMFIFVWAGVTGIIVLIGMYFRRGNTLQWRSILGGISLGIPNYFSYLFLLKALTGLPWGSSVVFPLNNLGTVAFATFGGVVLFKERISKTNLAGLIAAFVAVILIVISSR